MFLVCSILSSTFVLRNHFSRKYYHEDFDFKKSFTDNLI